METGDTNTIVPGTPDASHNVPSHATDCWGGDITERMSSCKDVNFYFFEFDTPHFIAVAGGLRSGHRQRFFDKACAAEQRAGRRATPGQQFLVSLRSGCAGIML
jgi:hypothetical protein